MKMLPSENLPLTIPVCLVDGKIVGGGGTEGGRESSEWDPELPQRQDDKFVTIQRLFARNLGITFESRHFSQAF